MLSKPIACPKPKSRVQLKAESRPLERVNQKAFAAKVWHRDRNRCRCCGRKVVKSLARVPERGEVHHLYGRVGDLRFEPRGAILVCLRDHERLTGRVNEKWMVEFPTSIPSYWLTFKSNQQEYIDAVNDLRFQRVV